MARIKRTPRFNFQDLFVFEMANNHQGDVEHGKRIIREFAQVAKEANICAAMKLQFRELDTFIHPAYRESKENKHIPRFLGTSLTEDQFAELVAEIKSCGLISMATPFDELSVDMLERLGVEVIKIGSCSASDRPLLECIAESGKPVICSVGGLQLADDDITARDSNGFVNVDWLNTFFKKRSVDFALMYCVSIYPMSSDCANLEKIARMRKRYPDITIGFSTHEDPNNTTFVGLAYAKGARMFEKHVGIPTDTITLNAYSAIPEQVRAWIGAYREARIACGTGGDIFFDREIKDLRSLMRGVYTVRAVRRGERIERRDVFFAIPIADGQLSSGAFVDGIVADRDYAQGEAIPTLLVGKKSTHRNIIFNAINTVIGMLNEAQIVVGEDFSVELSHHYGIEKFNEVGSILVNCFNYEKFAKKIIIQLPGQWNPAHYHKKKEEVFRF